MIMITILIKVIIIIIIISHFLQCFFSMELEAHNKKDRGHGRAAMPWGGVGVGIPHTSLADVGK